MAAVVAVVVVGAGLVTGLAAGGTLTALGHVKFRGTPLLFAAAGSAVVVMVAPVQLRTAGWAGVYAFVSAWVLWNAREHRGLLGTGVAVAAVGIILNSVPVLLNGGMPVAVPVTDADRAAKVESSPRHSVSELGTRASFLGDVIPIRADVAGRVFDAWVSPGDLVLWLGMILTAAGATLHPPRSAYVRSDPTRFRLRQGPTQEPLGPG